MLNPSSRHSNNYLYVGVLILLIGITGAFHLLWLAIDNGPPLENGIDFMLQGMKLHNALELCGEWPWSDWFSSYVQHLNLIDIVWFFYYAIFGVGAQNELALNILFFIFAAIGLYKLGSCCGDRKTGLLSTLIFFSMPSFLAYSKLGYREFHLMSLLPLTLYLLYRITESNKRSVAVWCGLLCATLCLIKLEVIIHLIVPFIAVCYIGFQKKKISREGARSLWLNLLICLSVLVVTVNLWYFFTDKNEALALASRTIEKGVYKVGVSSSNVLFYYYSIVHEMLNRSMLIVIIASCVIVTIGALLTRTFSRFEKSNLVLFASAGFSFLMMSFLSPKGTAHLISMLVFVSIMLANMILSIKPRLLKVVMVMLLAAHYICFNVEFVFGAYWQASPYIMVSPLDHFTRSITKGRIIARVDYPNAAQWDDGMKRILETIWQDHNTVYKDKVVEDPPSVIIAANNTPVRFFQFEYYNQKNKDQLALIPVLQDSSRWYAVYVDKLLYEDGHQYLVLEVPLSSGMDEGGGEEFCLAKVLGHVAEDQRRFLDNYTLVKEVSLPMGRMVHIYRFNALEKK